MTMHAARFVTIEWEDGSKDTWRDITVDDHITGEGGTHPGSPEAMAIRYKTLVLMESKVVDHVPAPPVVVPKP